MNFFEKTYFICKIIPYGKVASYGQIAKLAGNPKMARQVGWAMNKVKEGDGVPAHRVVNRLGELSGAGAFEFQGEQEAKLLSEGIEINNGKVNMKKYCWKPNSEELGQINGDAEQVMDFYEFVKKIDEE